MRLDHLLSKEIEYAESNLMRASRKAKVESSARRFFEISKAESETKAELSEKNFLKSASAKADVGYFTV